MALGVLTIHLHFPGCSSLKEKRGYLKPLLVRLQREFNISVAEIDLQDIWQDAVIACALISSDHNDVQRTLPKIVHWIEHNRPDIDLIDEKLEIIM
jgi:uncharacterized protein